MTDAPPTRAELAALYAEDNRARALHDEYMRQRNARASPRVRETDSEGVMYRTIDNNALDAAPAAEGEGIAEEPDEDPWYTAVLSLTDAVENRFDYEERERKRLECELSYLKGQLDVMLQLVKSGNTTTVVKTESELVERHRSEATSDTTILELPNWRQKDVA
jgi:hypothetical protein